MKSQVEAALAWLIHPVSLVALGLLLLNDHLFKAAFGSWWTGKLSDVAGLIFFPALVAVVLAIVAPVRWPHPRLALAAVVLTGAGFAWVKATDAGAATASSLLSALVGPSVVLRDPTDLFALVALPVAWWVSRRTVALGSAGRRAVAVVALPVAVLGSAATSYAPARHADDVAQVDGTLWVAVSYPYRSSDVEWVSMSPRGKGLTDRVREQLEALDPPVTQACLDQGACFRPSPGRYGVDISHDGGQTWEPDFAVTDVQWERLAKAWQDSNPKEKRLVTASVRVGEWEGTPVVFAANGMDGIAVRHTDGTWERLGWLGNRDDVPPMPPDDPRDDAVIGKFVGAGLLVFSVVAYMTLMLVRRESWRDAPRAWVSLSVALWCLTVGALFAWSLLMQARETAAEAAAATPFPSLLMLFTAALFLGVTVVPLRFAVGRRSPSRGALALQGLAVGVAAVLIVLVLVKAGSVWAYAHREVLTLAITVVLASGLAVIHWVRPRNEALPEDPTATLVVPSTAGGGVADAVADAGADAGADEG